MSIDRKMTWLTGIVLVVLLGLILLGRYELTSLKTDMTQLVQNEFIPVIDKEVLPLLKEDALTLINKDFPWVAEHNTSWILMLEADRDVHQALIAERDAIGAADAEQYAKADKDNSDNIGQAEGRMKKASAVFETDEAKAHYKKFEESFASWKEKSRAVVKAAQDKSKAVQSTETGGDSSSFQVMRTFIDTLQAAVSRRKSRIFRRRWQQKMTRSTKGRNWSRASAPR